MARPTPVDVAAVVQRELTRLARVNMPVADFLQEAELSDNERVKFDESLGKKSPFLYVDGYNFAIPVPMVGTFEVAAGEGE